MTPVEPGPILKQLALADVSYILVDGTAAVLQGSPLLTADVDIVHERTPENIERLLNVLKALNGRYRSRPDLKPQTDHLVPTCIN